MAFLLATRDDEPRSNRDLVCRPDRRRRLAGDPARRADGRTRSGRSCTRPSEPSRPPELAQACARASGGNPFFLTELARELASAPRRPGRRSRPSRSTTSAPPRCAASCCCGWVAWATTPGGWRRRWRRWAARASCATPRRWPAWTPRRPSAPPTCSPTRASWTRGRPLRMTHPLVRAAVTGELRGADEAALHRRAYEVLRDDGARSSVAVHPRAEGGAGRRPRRGRAADAELDARAAQRVAQVAAVHLNRALAEPPTPEARGPVIAALGRAEVAPGRLRRRPRAPGAGAGPAERPRRAPGCPPRPGVRRVRRRRDAATPGTWSPTCSASCAAATTTPRCRSRPTWRCWPGCPATSTSWT